MKLIIWELKIDSRSYNCSPKQLRKKTQGLKGKKGVCMYVHNVSKCSISCTHEKRDLQLQLPHSPHLHAKNQSLCVPLPTPWHHNPKDTTIIKGIRSKAKALHKTMTCNIYKHTLKKKHIAHFFSFFFR